VRFGNASRPEYQTQCAPAAARATGKNLRVIRRWAQVALSMGDQSR
jgi:hypothetical protein